MGLATMKVATMLPFLLLFHRKKDLKTWFAIGATVVVLVLLGGQPSRLLNQCPGDVALHRRILTTGCRQRHLV